MADDNMDWDLLSNGSGSDSYWPDSEVDDTVSLLDHLSFSESDEEVEEESEMESEEESDNADVEDNHDDEDTNSVCDDATLTGGLQDRQGQEDATEFKSAKILLNGFEASHMPGQTSISQTIQDNRGEPTTPLITSEMMDRMSGLIENTITSLLKILSSPQILSEKDFVIRLLDDLEFDCENLKTHAHPRTQLVQRLEALVSKVLECATSLGNRPPTTTPPTRISESRTPELREQQESDYHKKVKSVADNSVPEWRRRDPATSFETNVPNPLAIKTEEAIQNLRDQFKALNNYKVCQCSVSCSSCRIHPSVFRESTSVPKYRPPHTLTELKKPLEHRYVDEMVGGVKNGSWRKVQGFLYSVYGDGPSGNGSWDRIKAFLNENYVAPSYEEPICEKDINRKWNAALYG